MNMSVAVWNAPGYSFLEPNNRAIKTIISDTAKVYRAEKRSL